LKTKSIALASRLTPHYAGTCLHNVNGGLRWPAFTADHENGRTPDEAAGDAALHMETTAAMEADYDVMAKWCVAEGVA
jgi:hypothetical protein